MIGTIKMKKGLSPTNYSTLKRSSSGSYDNCDSGRNKGCQTRLPLTLSICTPTIKPTTNHSFRKPPVIISNTSKHLNSILLSNKSKLNAFNELVDDIYKGEIDYPKQKHKMLPECSPVKPTELTRAQSTRVLSSNRKTRRSLVDDVKGLKNASHTPNSAQKTNQERISIAKLLQANLNTGKLDELHKIQVDKLKFFKTKSKMNCFILKVLDPDAMIEDFTEGKGKLSVHFKKFKMQLHKEKVRLTNLVNDVKQAHVMNETLLKIYTVKLKSKHSKYFNMQNVEGFNHFN